MKHFLTSFVLTLVLTTSANGTPLIHAIKTRNYPVASVLVKRDQRVFEADAHGATALHWAAAIGWEAMVEKLLNMQAPIACVTEAGETPLHWAVWYHKEPTVDILLERGANPNAPSQNGRTPLHIAALRGHVPIAQALLLAGADRTLLDAHGKTAESLTTLPGVIEGIMEFKVPQPKRRGLTSRIRKPTKVKS